MSVKKAIHVKKMYDGDMNSPLEDVVVMIDGETISDILDVKTAKSICDANTLWIDASQKYMTPGLIDVHTHLMMKGAGEMAEVTLARHNTGEMQLIAITNALTALKAGVTTLRDCGSKDGISRAVKRFINDGFIQGPDVFICGMPVTSTGGHCHYMGGEADGETEIRKLVRRQQKEGIDFVKLMATAGGTIGVARGNTYQDFEIAAAVEEAHRLGLKISMHCCSIDGVRTAVAAGTDGMEHAMFSNDQGELILDPKLAEKLAQQKIQVCHTLPALGATLWMLDRKPKADWTAFDHSEYIRIGKAQEDLYKTIYFHFKAGVECVAGSDSGWKHCNFSLGMPLALELMSQSGLPTLEIIHSATGRAAKYLSADNRLGTLQKGKQADLLLLDVDPEEDIKTFYNVATVYKKGKKVTDFLN